MTTKKTTADKPESVVADKSNNQFKGLETLHKGGRYRRNPDGKLERMTAPTKKGDN